MTLAGISIIINILVDGLHSAFQGAAVIEIGDHDVADLPLVRGIAIDGTLGAIEKVGFLHGGVRCALELSVLGLENEVARLEVLDEPAEALDD